MVAKKHSQTWQDMVHKNWMTTLGFAFVLFLLAYGGASWAIDNGSLWLYGITLVIIYLGFKELKRGILVLFHKK